MNISTKISCFLISESDWSNDVNPQNYVISAPLMLLGITMLIKVSVKNSLSVDAKATAIALATQKNANQFAYFSKNPRSLEVILTLPKLPSAKWKSMKGPAMMVEMIC